MSHPSDTDGARFVSRAPLDAEAFWAAAERLGRPVYRFRKTGRVAARRAARLEPVLTHWNGVETTNTAHPGDYVVTTLDRRGAPLEDGSGALNQYVVDADRFPALYRATTARSRNGRSHFGRTYTPRADVQAFFLREGFDIVAPWGERQVADRGYVLLNDDDVYGNHQDTFNATYRRLGPARGA